MKRYLMFLLPFIGGIAIDRLFVERPVHAQSVIQSSLPIGDAVISVGMAKQDALAALSRYNIIDIDGGMFTVTTKPVLRNGANYLRFLGDVMFENGAVTHVTRKWNAGEGGAEIEKVWRSIWGAITASIPDSKRETRVSISAFTASSPAVQRQTIELYLASNRTVRIAWSDIDADATGLLLTPNVGRVSSLAVEETVF